ncbi:unnamed protein product [Fraxinus pennsylvanica]|uniref:Uncharacterized protein n=1 Tax=Fraxinus pennsylvanica TaxID=56036 RepID=A0AAD2EA61_9LAMI|nr:unnamed protein product [Fraxinus pennsylvanica]
MLALSPPKMKRTPRSHFARLPATGVVGGSTENNASPFHTRSSPPKSLRPINLNSRVHSSSSDYSPLVVLNSSSPRSLASKPLDSLLNFSTLLPRYILAPPPREPMAYMPFSPSSFVNGVRNSSPWSFEFLGVRKANPIPSFATTASMKKMEEFKNDINDEFHVDVDEKLGGCVRGVGRTRIRVRDIENSKETEALLLQGGFRIIAIVIEAVEEHRNTVI